MKFDVPPFLEASGEYGATKVALNTDADMYRLAFGRSSGHGGEIYFAGIMLSKEAFESLKAQILALEE